MDGRTDGTTFRDARTQSKYMKEWPWHGKEKRPARKTFLSPILLKTMKQHSTYYQWCKRKLPTTSGQNNALIPTDTLQTQLSDTHTESWSWTITSRQKSYRRKRNGYENKTQPNKPATLCHLRTTKPSMKTRVLPRLPPCQKLMEWLDFQQFSISDFKTKW